jgi:hypothetical protein
MSLHLAVLARIPCVLTLSANDAIALAAMLRGEIEDASVGLIGPQAFHRITLWPHLEDIGRAVLHRAIAQLRANNIVGTLWRV